MAVVAFVVASVGFGGGGGGGCGAGAGGDIDAGTRIFCGGMPWQTDLIMVRPGRRGEKGGPWMLRPMVL